MAATGTVWLGSIVIDGKNWPEMISFCKAALGYEFVRAPSEDWALLYDPRGQGPNLTLQKDPEGPTGTDWFHFDRYASEPEREVERLLQLGASMRQPANEPFDYVTLADPDGNPFDVVEARGFKFGQRTESNPSLPSGRAPPGDSFRTGECRGRPPEGPRRDRRTWTVDSPPVGWCGSPDRAGRRTR
jgi:hypothetical protein